MMSDTVGSLIDKLFTVDSKMWNNQEILYEIRRNDFEWFGDTYDYVYRGDDVNNYTFASMVIKRND